jgi:hypothetical protein
MRVDGSAMAEWFGQARASVRFVVMLLAVMGGLGAIWAVRTSDESAEAIAALAAAVIGVAGTHLGHMTGNALATQRSATLLHREGVAFMLGSLVVLILVFPIADAGGLPVVG